VRSTVYPRSFRLLPRLTVLAYYLPDSPVCIYVTAFTAGACVVLFLLCWYRLPLQFRSLRIPVTLCVVAFRITFRCVPAARVVTCGYPPTSYARVLPIDYAPTSGFTAVTPLPFTARSHSPAAFARFLVAFAVAAFVAFRCVVALHPAFVVRVGFVTAPAAHRFAYILPLFTRFTRLQLPPLPVFTVRSFCHTLYGLVTPGTTYRSYRFHLPVRNLPLAFTVCVYRVSYYRLLLIFTHALPRLRYRHRNVAWPWRYRVRHVFGLPAFYHITLPPLPFIP